MNTLTCDSEEEAAAQASNFSPRSRGNLRSLFFTPRVTVAFQRLFSQQLLRF